MNSLLLGSADKTAQLIERAGNSFLLIDDGPIADAFIEHFPRAKLFDVTRHTFNPLKGIDHVTARAFATAVYGGKDLMTYRDGKRALTKMLLEAKRLDKLPTITHKGYDDAVATIEDLLLSPVLAGILCKPTNFSFKGQVVVKLDRSVIGDFDAFILASLLIGQSQGHIILTDGGFYLRDFHSSLIRQNRLICGVNTLSELPQRLKDMLLLIKDKHGAQCTYEDAQTLALYEGLTPSTNEHTAFVQEAMA